MMADPALEQDQSVTSHRYLAQSTPKESHRGSVTTLDQFLNAAGFGTGTSRGTSVGPTDAAVLQSTWLIEARP